MACSQLLIKPAAPRGSLWEDGPREDWQGPPARAPESLEGPKSTVVMESWDGCPGWLHG